MHLLKTLCSLHSLYSKTYEWNFVGDLELELSIFKGLEFWKCLVVLILNSSRTLRLVRMI